MSVLRIGTADALLRAIETPGDARDVVLAELTVGESYFFRDSAQLELLATEILPARVERYGQSRPLRMWSAGCASGEESSTLAIMLREQRWPHPARILGTDIARPRLAAARRGRYTRWALRGVSDERIARWFNRNGIYYDLDHSVRDAVEYRSLNLVVDDYAIGEQGAEGFDLVLCRNVMIYFDLPTVARIATGLLASLAPDGWLVLGASDPPLAHLVPCEAVVTSAGIAYRRADSAGDATPPRVALPRLESAPVPQPEDLSRVSESPIRVPQTLTPALEDIRQQTPRAAGFTPVPRTHADVNTEKNRSAAAEHRSSTAELLRAYTLADYATAEKLAVATLSLATTEHDAQHVWIIYVRAVANQGRLNEAGELCARSLELFPLAAELHYLHATLLAEAGWFGDAAAAARRAIYLDRQLVMGHLLLGDALTRTGDQTAARIAFENVIHLLTDVESDTPVAAADGVPVTRLRQIATLRLRTLVTPGAR